MAIAANHARNSIITTDFFIAGFEQREEIGGNDLQGETDAKSVPSHDTSRKRGASNGSRWVNLLVRGEEHANDDILLGYVHRAIGFCNRCMG